MTRVVFLLAPGVLLLDLAGPAQVFATAAGAGADYRLDYVAETARVASGHGLILEAATAWPTLEPEDLLVVPGWRAPLQPGSGGFADPTLHRIRAHHEGGGTVVSVCSGAFALGRAGLLEGRRCTTHHDIQHELQRRNPGARVIHDVLYVDDDRVLSSAGIASGIDLALFVLAQRHGPAFAAGVAREMVVYARRNGDAAQLSALLRHRSHVDELVHRVQDLIDRAFDQPLPLAELAEGVHASPRTVTRAFVAATGLTPLRYQQLLRRERAEYLMAQGLTADAAAREVGFEDARMLRRLRAAAPAPVA
ncbi:DJ-1/PfpI family protein [Agromyces mediolanus]|uniref:GlxA family transcriptional regulator n=1 Tax=Agromyces mediolanus TaxID=41986 RepID=UPI0038357505